jgi:hypothetical protein
MSVGRGSLWSKRLFERLYGIDTTHCGIDTIGRKYTFSETWLSRGMWQISPAISAQQAKRMQASERTMNRSRERESLLNAFEGKGIGSPCRDLLH